MVICRLVSVSGDAQSPFPDAPGAHPDYDAFHFNKEWPVRKDPNAEKFEALRDPAAVVKLPLALLCSLFYN